MDQRPTICMLGLAVGMALSLYTAPGDAERGIAGKAFVARNEADEEPWDEAKWTEKLAQEYDAEVGMKTQLWDGSYPDLLTKEYAFEIDWAHKWKEAPTQAGYYAIVTHRKPAVILLKGKDPKDQIYCLKCQAFCAKYGIELYVRETWKK